MTHMCSHIARKYKKKKKKKQVYSDCFILAKFSKHIHLDDKTYNPPAPSIYFIAILPLVLEKPTAFTHWFKMIYSIYFIYKLSWKITQSEN